MSHKSGQSRPWRRFCPERQPSPPHHVTAPTTSNDTCTPSALLASKKRCFSLGIGARCRNEASTSDASNICSNMIALTSFTPTHSLAQPTASTSYSSSNEPSLSTYYSISPQHPPRETKQFLPASFSSLSLSSPSPAPIIDDADNHRSQECITALCSQLAEMPVGEFKSLLCPILPDLFTANPSLCDLIESRRQCRSRWQCLEKNVLARCLSYLTLWDLFTVNTVNHHWYTHSRSSMIYKCVFYDPLTCPPIKNDRSLHALCKKLHNGSIPLTRMSLTGCSITSLGLSSLTLLAQSLTGLNLSCMIQLDDCAMHGIAKLKSLTCLSLCGTSITDCGMRYLQCLHSLTKLGVMYCPGITENSIQFLKNMPTLKSLAINASHFTPQGFQQFGEIQSLKCLQLDCMLLSTLGQLSVLTQLETLEFSITTNGMLLENDISNSSGNGIKSVVFDLSPLSVLVKLVSLNIHVDRACDWSFVQWNDALFAPLTSLSQLKTFQFDSCVLCDESLAAIKHFPSLMALQLDGRISDTGLRHIGECQTLTTLALTSCKITDAGIAALASGLGNLAYLSLTYAHLSRRSVQALRLCESLSKLCFERMNFPNEFIDELFSLPALTEVKFDGCGMTAASVAKLRSQRQFHVSCASEALTESRGNQCNIIKHFTKNNKIRTSPRSKDGDAEMQPDAAL